MSKTVTMYRWYEGEIISKEVDKSSVKYETGWKTEPEQAMYSQYRNHSYHLKNDVYSLIQRVDILLQLEKELNAIGIKNNEKLEEVENIELLIGKLNQLSEK